MGTEETVVFQFICIPTQSQEISVCGGVTDTIFPKTESMLLDNLDCQRALEYVAARKRMDAYRSMIDFMFCELYSEWRMSCKRFYAGNGPQLKDQITDQQIEYFDNKLVKALQVALGLFREQRCKSWVKFKHALRLAA